MKKLVVLDGHLYPEGAFVEVADLCKSQGIAFEVLDCKTQDDVIRLASDADACMVYWLHLNGDMLDHLPKLKMVVRCGVGVDNIDVDGFTQHNVLVCNVPDYGVEEVAVHGLSLMLALERKIVFYNQKIHAGIWDENLGYDMRRLSEQTLGFLGFGRIARDLASLAKPIYGNIIAYDPYLKKELFNDVEPVDLDTLFETADSLVVLAPATEETYHVVNCEHLKKAKKGLRLVNVARGALVDLQAILWGLDQGVLAGAALDVLEQEPPTDALFHQLKRPDVILTPHAAYRSVESLHALKVMAAKTAICYLLGNEPYHVINAELLAKPGGK